MASNYYQILEIPIHATLAEIKQAYRRLAKMYHPDVNPNNTTAQALFIEIQKAYSILSNEQLRHHYNINQGIFSSKQQSFVFSINNYLQRWQHLAQQVAQADPHRLNLDGILLQMEKLLTNYEVLQFRQTADSKAYQALHLYIIQTITPLDKQSLQYIIPQLLPLQFTVRQENDFHNMLIKRKTEQFWAVLLPVFMLVIAVVLCIILATTLTT
ncbi:MAG: J domain-containing protein [Chitinophagaceae bacterium]